MGGLNKIYRTILQLKGDIRSGVMMRVFLISFLGLQFISANLTDRFPDGFLIGFSTSSYQIEGGWKDDGKGENIWDRLVHTQPDLIADKSKGDVACDSYNKYKEDIKSLKDIGADIYRFSLSWSRILPNGDISKINEPGIKYYNNLINGLLKNNIQPMITLFHWDLPQPLQNLGGWPNPVLVEYFEDYARLAFKTFGDRVKWWITFNEPLEICTNGYGSVYSAPVLNMSGIADYLCAHTIIKSHARAYHIYDDEFRKSQKGKITITLNGGYNQPYTDSEEDKEAAETYSEFQLGWFLHPIVKGDYPLQMRKRVDENSKAEGRARSRLPYFNDFWRIYIKGTLDYLGVNHYTTYLVTPATEDFPSPSFNRDVNVTVSQNSSWPNSTLSWLRVEPTGIRKKLNWLKNYTYNLPVFITENGYADKGKLSDSFRINYHRLYLKEILKAIYSDNCHVLGYSAWSLIDNFEWLEGFSVKFGVYYVDFNNSSRPRRPKLSVKFFKTLLKTRRLPSISREKVNIMR